MRADRLHQLSGSSNSALAWASTRARHRESSKQATSTLISAVDLLVGLFLTHPNASEPYQLLSHFQVPVTAFYDTLRSLGGFAPDDAPSSPEPLNQVLPLDTELEQIFDQSFMISKQYNPEKDGLVRLRDLFGGMLEVPNKARELLQQTLSIVATPLEQIVATYAEFLSYPADAMPLSKFLAERFPSPQPSHPAQAEPPPPIRFAVSGFSSDTRTEQDLIGIGAEVDAFAYLIAAKALQPPLAIGLFGDWGSGKSFFMEALRQRIHKITADAQESGVPQGQISIFKYIAQIEFNAWHYVEGELWASLVEHIFRNLKTRAEDAPTLLQQRQQLVIERLEIARRAQMAAQARQATLANELSQAQQRVTMIEQQREAALKELNNLKVRDVLAAVELSEADQKAIKQTLGNLGATETYNSAAELVHGIEELRALLQRGNALTTPLRERGWKWPIALIAVIMIGPIISLALTRIGEVPVATNALASISAFLSGLTVMLKRGTAWLSSALAQVEGAWLRLDAKRREVELRFAGEIAEAERQYNQKAAEYDQAKQAERAKEREIAELEQELQQITPGRVLLDFISERVGSQDYRKHLGIAALIRSDFEQLSQLIADQNKAALEQDDGSIHEQDRHAINRIVLYIDDLDRCPPDRVVQVLQAVHLLLAFPLFVVVLAVDARWLSQSLQAHYKNLLATSAGRDGTGLVEDFAGQASPQDYLEKIFQIPFWVRPLHEKARIRIVKGLVAETLIPPPMRSAGAGEQQPTTTDTNQSNTAGTTSVDRKLALVHWESSERRLPLNLDAETDLKPEGLDIHAIELQFMDDLRSLLGETPRAVKRFVNIYRLIKAVALNQAPKFVDDAQDADFKRVLFLLAVLTGLPAISRRFFGLLSGERKGIESAPPPCQFASAPAERTLAQVLESLSRLVLEVQQAPAKDPIPSRHAIPAVLERHTPGLVGKPGAEDWDALRDLDRLETWLRQYDDGSWQQLHVAAFADWAPQVARFSYRIEQL